MKIHGEYPKKKVIQSYALKLYRDAGQEDFKVGIQTGNFIFNFVSKF